MLYFSPYISASLTYFHLSARHAGVYSGGNTCGGFFDKLRREQSAGRSLRFLFPILCDQLGGVFLKDPLQEEGGEQGRHRRHKQGRPPVGDAEGRRLRRQKGHHHGGGQMAHRQLEGCHKQLPHPKGESSQQGEQPAKHPRRQEQGRIVGPEEHAGGAGGGGNGGGSGGGGGGGGNGGGSN